VSKTDKPPVDGWASDTAYAASSAFEEDSLPERQITLSIRIPPLHLPGEHNPPQAALSSWRPPAAEAPAHLDAWNRDRVQRSSLPPSALVAPSGSSSAAKGFSPGYVGAEGDPDIPALESEGDALALASRPSHFPPALDLVSEMSERFALGDFSGALRAAELLLGQDSEHALADHYARESRYKLEGLYTSRITAHGRTPVLTVLESEVRWFGLDSRAGLLLPHVDGTSDYETVVALSGMPRLEALRCLAELVEANVVRLV
jgi:hypothetical protein